MTAMLDDKLVEAEQPASFLYFLVCSASTGPRAGLFKLGITNDLGVRYRQNASAWEEFDLQRSARLRSGSYREVRSLESVLKDRFEQWRRHPGSEDAGYTEFFAIDCLPEMLTLAHSLGVCGLGGHLSRGIDPTECMINANDEGASALARKQQGELSAQRHARKRQEKAEWGGHITHELETVRWLARNFQEYLVWVDLTHWHELLALGEGARRADKGMLDLYFGRFLPPPTNAEEEEVATRCHTAESFTIWVERLQWAAVSTHTSPLSKYRPKAMFYLQESVVDPSDKLPHPVCAGTVLLRVQCARCIPQQPFLAEFEEMVRQIESHRSLEQLSLDL